MSLRCWGDYDGMIRLLENKRGAWGSGLQSVQDAVKAIQGA